MAPAHPHATVFLGMHVGGGAWGADGGWLPLLTCPQQYCDPVSIVDILSNNADFRYSLWHAIEIASLVYTAEP